MIIDCHTHIGECECRGIKGASIPEMVKIFDSYGVDKAIVMTIKGFFTDYIEANNELYKSVKDSSNKFIAFSTVDPNDTLKARDELRRSVEVLGMKGLKLHPWLQGFSVSDMIINPLVEECIRLDIPIMFHDGTPPYSTPLQICNLGSRYPDLKIILGHSGLNDLWKNALQGAKKNKNVFLCLCGPPLFALERIVREVNIDQLCFGSDIGFGPEKGRFLYSLDKIKALSISQEDKNKILGENIARLLGIPLKDQKIGET